MRTGRPRARLQGCIKLAVPIKQGRFAETSVLGRIRTPRRGVPARFEAGIDTAITTQLSLRVVFQDLYASKPAPGKKHNDLRLLAGAVYMF